MWMAVYSELRSPFNTRLRNCQRLHLISDEVKINWKENLFGLWFGCRLILTKDKKHHHFLKFDFCNFFFCRKFLQICWKTSAIKWHKHSLNQKRLMNIRKKKNKTFQNFLSGMLWRIAKSAFFFLSYSVDVFPGRKTSYSSPVTRKNETWWHFLIHLRFKRRFIC